MSEDSAVAVIGFVLSSYFKMHSLCTPFYPFFVNILSVTLYFTGNRNTRKKTGLKCFFSS